MAAAEAGARARAARAALGEAAARAKGDELREACKRKDVAAALRLIDEGAHPDCASPSGNSPLTWASVYEELDSVAARLVAAGAKLDPVDPTESTSALTYACATKRAATALLLVEAGAAINQVSNDGRSALDRANEKGLAAVSAAIRARGGRTGAETRAGK